MFYNCWTLFKICLLSRITLLYPIYYTKHKFSLIILFASFFFFFFFFFFVFNVFFFFFYCIGLQSFFRYLLMKYSTSCILVGKCIDIPLFNVDCPMSFIFLNVKNWLSYSVHTPDRSLVNRAWENYMLVVSKYIKKLISM